MIQIVPVGSSARRAALLARFLKPLARFVGVSRQLLRPTLR